MPLEKSRSEKAFKRNVSTLMKEVGTSPHVKSRKQALAIAHDIKRKARAAGGALAAPPTPWFARNEAKGMTHAGPIMSVIPGRTDRHDMNVASGSYVVPAHAVSHLGQSNTMAGMAILNKMFNMGPYGSAPGKVSMGRGAPRARAKGGGVGEPTPVVVAGGEFVIPPEKVAELGGGDIKHGHKILDAWMRRIQREHAKTIRKLPAPAKR